MGNERWILGTIQKLPDRDGRAITEIGAGDGNLSCTLARRFPQAVVSACDLAPAPQRMPSNLHWQQGNIFEAPEEIRGNTLIANLFLHHFEAAELRQIGKITDRFDSFIFCEPDRARLPHFHGSLLHPFINRVTRHDMHVSIDAGFTAGEIPRFLGLDTGRWEIREQSNWRGSRRVVGWRV